MSNLKVGDYVFEKTSDPTTARVWQIVEITQHHQGTFQATAYGVMPWPGNPEITKWGSSEWAGPLAALDPMPEMLLIARVYSGEHLFEKPPWIKGWLREAVV